MVYNFKTFIENAYHYFMEVMTYDYIIRVTLKKGTVVVISEEKYECLIELLADKVSEK